MDYNKVWVITGASKGLGLSLAQQRLQRGYRSTTTSRTPDALIAALGPRSEHFLPLDLLAETSVHRAIAPTLQHFGAGLAPFLRADAFAAAQQKITAGQTDLHAWKTLSTSTSFDHP